MDEVIHVIYYRWRKTYRGMHVNQALKLKALGKENSQPKKLMAALSLTQASCYISTRNPQFFETCPMLAS